MINPTISDTEYEYDVALSYASEDRNCADALAKALIKQDIKVFYDRYEQHTLWGRDLYTYLSELYRNKARYCVMLLSKYYASKLWTKHERESAQARAFAEQDVYILPIRLDDTEIPGFLPTIAFLNWQEETVETITQTILKKLGRTIETLSLPTLRSSPSSPPKATPSLEKSKIEVPNEEDDLKWYENALHIYEQRINLDPNDADAYNSKGIALNDLGQYEKAIHAYDQAIALDPHNPDAYYNKGNTLRSLRRYEEAIHVYDQAIALDPHDPDVYNNKGLAFSKLNRYEEAIIAYDQAIALDSNYEKAYNNKGLDLSSLRQYEEAIRVFDQFIDLDPHDYHTYYNKGDTLRNLRRYEAAVRAYDQAIALDPHDPDVYNNKGLALIDIRRYEDAILAFDQAIALDSNYAKAYNNKGDALRAMKRKN